MALLFTGVRRELVDLTRVTSLDARKARQLFDSGIHTVAELAAAPRSQIIQQLQAVLPFERYLPGCPVVP